MKGPGSTAWFKPAMIAISTFLMLGTAFITPPAGLSQSGLQVLGILAGALVLWLSVSVDWTSLYVIFALMTVPQLSVPAVTAGSFGHMIVVFLVATFILSASLQSTGVAKRLSIWFITSKVSRKGPWFTIMMIFFSVFVLSAGLSSTATLLIFLPILYEIFAELKFDQNDAIPSMLVMGTAFIAQVSQGMTPISHAMTILGMGTYQSYTKETIDMFSYMAICIPIGLILFCGWLIICKFFWKPDVRKLSSLDYKNIKKNIGPMTAEEVITAIVYVSVIILWILPGISKYFFPSAYPVLKKINICYPPILGALILSVIRINGKAILDYKKAVKNSVPWSTVIFMGAILMLGKALSDKAIGISPFIASVMSDVLSGVSPTIFVMAIVGFAILLTNFISNSVTIAVVFAIGMPIIGTIYSGSISPLLVGILMTSGASYAFATPPATPPVAVAADSGWVNTKQLFRWGMTFAILSIAVFYLVGIPLANSLL